MRTTSCRGLPDGYETLVGDGGRTLSSGERRRIALARALVREAPLLILDEPTADLDPESADLVAEALDRLHGRCSILVIAHRLELLRPADRVVVLEAGRALEQVHGVIAATFDGCSRSPAPRDAALRSRSASDALTILLGVGLTASAGYLISRAAEHPPVLSLMTAIVAVRFFGLTRPIARYLERLSSHDLAFRDLARVRVRTYERLEPLAPGQLESYRKGDLLSRLRRRRRCAAEPASARRRAATRRADRRGGVRRRHGGLPAARRSRPRRRAARRPASAAPLVDGPLRTASRAESGRRARRAHG